jgi:hypothetical protein
MKTPFGIALIIFATGFFSCTEAPAIERDLSEPETVTQEQNEHENIADEPSSEVDLEEITYNTYCNDRFHFCIAYPSEILIAQGESDSRDGQIFKSNDGENTLWVYRDYRDNMEPSEYTIETAYTEDLEPTVEKSVTYNKLGTDYYVVSGYVDGKIYYQKTMMLEGELMTALIEYSKKDKAVYGQISKKIFSSFE